MNRPDTEATATWFETVSVQNLTGGPSYTRKQRSVLLSKQHPNCLTRAQKDIIVHFMALMRQSFLALVHADDTLTLIAPFFKVTNERIFF